MREIKFRGKRKDNGEWIVGHYGYKDLTDEHFIITPTFDAHSDKRPQYFTDHLVEPDTASQYTGLKDKNDKEIYEGDIIRWHGIVTSDYPITFSDGVFCLDDRTDENFHHHRYEIRNKWEVIGNIYENTDLLK
jgi:uncharacterized phage protein (TIGR01671 family)